MKKLIITTTAFLAMIYNANAQFVFTKLYNQCFAFNKVIQNNNEFLSIGLNVFNNERYFTLIKATLNGNITNTYDFKQDNQGSYFYFTGLTKLPDGNFIAVGQMDDTCFNCASGILIKINSTFTDTLWTKEYKLAATNDALLNNLIVCGNGDFVCCGQTLASANPFQTQTILARFDPQGNTIWEKQYNSTHKYNNAIHLSETTDGGFMVAGGVNDPGNHKSDALLFKTDSLGNLQWKQEIGGAFADEMANVQKTNDNKYIVAFVDGIKIGTSPPAEPIKRINIRKIDLNGTVIWQKYIGKMKDQVASPQSINILQNGDILLAGHSSGDAFSGFFKLTANGDSIWYREYVADSTDIKMGGWSVNQLWACAETTDGGFVCGGGFSGRTGPTGGTQQKAWLLKTDQNGCQTTQCQNTIGINENKNNAQNIRIYPNPANEYITIETNNPKQQTIQIIDLLGKIWMEKSIHSNEKITIQELPNAIYIIKTEKQNLLFIKN